jgi:hypothetical protein
LCFLFSLTEPNFVSAKRKGNTTGQPPSFVPKEERELRVLVISTRVDIKLKADFQLVKELAYYNLNQMLGRFKVHQV